MSLAGEKETSQITNKNRWSVPQDRCFSTTEIEGSGSELTLQNRVSSPMDRHYFSPYSMVA